MQTHIKLFFKKNDSTSWSVEKKKITLDNILIDQNKEKLLFRSDAILELTDVRDYPTWFSVS